MQINITLDGTEGSHELNALAALIASLGGRATTPPQTLSMAEARDMGLDEPGMLKVRKPGDDDEGEARNTDTSEKDAEIIDAAVAAGAPAFDSAGLPWDDRIHAASRATVADGTWRKRRNVPDEQYDAISAELRAAHPTTPATDDVPPPPPANTMNDTPEPPAPEPVVTAPAAVVAEPAADVPAPPPPSTDGPDLSSFAKFVGAVNAKDVPQENKVYEALNKLAKEVAGVDAFKDLLKKPESWALFYDMV